MTSVTLELPDELVTNFDLKQLTKEFTDFLLSKNKLPTKPLIGVAPHDSSTKFFTEWNNAEFTEMAMNQAMRGMENEPAIYSLNDLKERW